MRQVLSVFRGVHSQLTARKRRTSGHADVTWGQWQCRDLHHVGLESDGALHGTGNTPLRNICRGWPTAPSPPAPVPPPAPPPPPSPTTRLFSLRRDTEDAETKVPCDESPELLKVLSFKPGARQKIASYTPLTARTLVPINAITFHGSVTDTFPKVLGTK